MRANNLPEKWRCEPLREVATINYGKSPKEILSDEGTIPVVGTGGVERYGNAYLYDNASIVLGRKGTIDKVAYVDEKFWAIDTTYYLSDFQDANVKWLYYFLQTIDFRLLNEATGVPSLSRELLYKISVLIPTPEEQTQIVAILSTLDLAIEQTEAIIAKQQRIKAGLMQNLLNKGIDEHGVIRSEATHKFKDSPLGRIPVEWDVTSLGNIISKHGGKLQTGPFGSQLHAYEYVVEGIPVVMPQDISIDGISTDEIARIPEGKANQLLRHNMQPGDLIFARRGDLSRCAWITEHEEGWVCGTGCLLLRPPAKIISSRWMSEVYRFYKTQLQVDIQSVGSTMPNLNTGILSGLIICLPDFEEQVRIENYLCAIETDEQRMRFLHRKLISQKTGLMRDLLTGAVRVN